MSTCGCPCGLGYRFHRHPCPRAGQIDAADRVSPVPNPSQPADNDTEETPT